MSRLDLHLQSFAAASTSQDPNVGSYSQQTTFGFDVNGNIIRVSLVKLSEPDRFQFGSPYLNVGNVATDQWGPDIKLPNPQNLSFVAVSAMTGYNKTSYIILLSNTGKVYIIYQETTNTNWRWYGEMTESGGQTHTFTWMTTGIGNGNNLQVVLLTKTGTPYLLWQNYSNGSWAWGNLPYDNSKTFSTVQLGKGNGGNLQAVLTGTNGLPYLIWQDNGNGNWNWCGQLPTDGNTNFSQIQSFNSNSNNLQNVFLDKNNNLYLIWQESGSGGWNWYGRLPLQGNVFNGTIAFYTIYPENADPNNLTFAVYIGKQVAPQSFDVYKINQNSAGTWTWGGFYKTIEL
jgi:hypothetical protein